MDDAPAFGAPLKDDGKDSASWRFKAGKRPPAEHHGPVGAKRFKVDNFKAKRTHGAGVVAVALKVSIVRLLPASSNCGARGEDKFIAVNIAFHEGGNVSAIPRLALLFKQRGNGLSIGGAKCGRHSSARYRHRNEHTGQEIENRLGHAAAS